MRSRYECNVLNLENVLPLDFSIQTLSKISGQYAKCAINVVFGVISGIVKYRQGGEYQYA